VFIQLNSTSNVRFPDKELAVEENLAALGRLLLLPQDYSSNRYVKTSVNQKLSYQLPEQKNLLTVQNLKCVKSYFI
jgi:hypothetical protein